MKMNRKYLNFGH